MISVKLDHDTETLVERGREAWQSLRRDETWEKWVAIGRAIEAGRNFIMRDVLHTNQPKGRAWSETFGWWLKHNGFDEIDKSVRSRLQSCLDNLPEIEAWRQEIGLTLRLQLNHPNAVLRRWQATRQIPSASGASNSRPGLREINMKLQEEVDAMTSKIRRLEDGEDRGPQITRTDTTADIVRVLMEWLPASKRHPVAAGLMRALKSTEPKKAG